MDRYSYLYGCCSTIIYDNEEQKVVEIIQNKRMKKYMDKRNELLPLFLW